MGASMEDEEFIRELVVRVPAIASLLDRHMAENDGRMRPTVFMEQLAAVVIDAAESGRITTDIGELLYSLDDGVAMNIAFDLIVDSFVARFEAHPRALEALMPVLPLGFAYMFPGGPKPPKYREPEVLATGQSAHQLLTSRHFWINAIIAVAGVAFFIAAATMILN